MTPRRVLLGPPLLGPPLLGRLRPALRCSRARPLAAYADALDLAEAAAARVLSAAGGAVAIGDVAAVEVAALAADVLRLELPPVVAAAARGHRSRDARSKP